MIQWLKQHSQSVWSWYLPVCTSSDINTCMIYKEILSMWKLYFYTKWFLIVIISCVDNLCEYLCVGSSIWSKNRVMCVNFFVNPFFVISFTIQMSRWWGGGKTHMVSQFSNDARTVCSINLYQWFQSSRKDKKGEASDGTNKQITDTKLTERWWEIVFM